MFGYNFTTDGATSFIFPVCFLTMNFPQKQKAFGDYVTWAILHLENSVCQPFSCLVKVTVCQSFEEDSDDH